MIHTDMDVWKAAMDLAIAIYRMTPALPAEERFGLSAQMKRSAGSIPSNIAEGAGRESDPDNRRFLFVARGSLNELATQLEICKRLGYVRGQDLAPLETQIVKVRQLLAGTIRSLAPHDV